MTKKKPKIIYYKDNDAAKETIEGLFSEASERKKEFLFELIRLTEDNRLMQLAEPYLDHEIRVTEVFKRAGLSDKATEEHLKQLKIQKRRISQPQKQEKSKKIFNLQLKKNVQINVAYGDISSELLISY